MLGAKARQVGFSHPSQRLNGLEFELGKEGEGDKQRSPMPKRQEKSRKTGESSPNATRRKGTESPSATMRAKEEELDA